MCEKIYFPISRTCTATFALKEANLRSKSYPFDWMGQSYETIAYILKNGIDHLFDDFEIYHTDLPPGDPPRILCKYYNIFFYHEAEPQSIKKIKEKYIKRYNTLIKDIKNTKEICLVLSVQNEISLKTHYEVYNIPTTDITGKPLDDNSLDSIKEAILEINPNITITTTKFHKEWHEMVEELKTPT